MTDYELVKAQVMEIAGIDETQAETYKSYIETAIAAVGQSVTDPANENDARVVNLCAAKACYMAALADNSDSVTSFKAGDVSYTVDETALAKRKAFLDSAESDCVSLLNSSGFSFKAV